MNEKDQKVVVISGGGGLLGKSFCWALAERGHIVIVSDIDRNKSEEVAKKISEAGYKADAYVLDITNKTSIDDLIKNIVRKYNRIDAVVNCAYPRNNNYGKPLEEITYNDFCENINIHLGGYFLVMQRFARYFCKCSGGVIINISSIYGTMTPRFEIYSGTEMTMPVEYAAIKSAILHLSRYFAQLYKKQGVRVNCISPGGILASQPNQFLEKYDAYCGTKGMLDADDVVGVLIFLLSNDSRYINGQNFIVDDGFSL